MLQLLPSWEIESQFDLRETQTTLTNWHAFPQQMICWRQINDLFFILSQALPQQQEIYYFQIKEMTDRYVQLTEDLQYCKREAASWRQKYNQAESQIQGMNDQIRELKKLIENLQQANTKLITINKQLNEDKQSIATEYSTQITMIKQQIQNKQKQIVQLQQKTLPTKIDQQIIIRQIKYDLNQEFNELIAIKDKKMQQIAASLEKVNYEREIEKQKFKLKIQSLQNNLRDFQKNREIEIQSYENRIKQYINTKPSEDKDYLRRIKRQNEDLRKKNELSQTQLTEVLQQKNQITKEYTKWINEYKKYINDHQTESQIYKTEVNRLNQLLQQQSNKRDQHILKDRERDIKRLKNELEQARDQIMSKQKKIGDFESQRIKLLNEIKIAKLQNQRASNVVEEALKDERDKLMKELHDARLLVDKLRSQNNQLHDQVYDITRLNVENKKRWEQNVRIEDQQYKNRLKRQKSEQILPAPDRQKRPVKQERAQNTTSPIKNNDLLAIEKAKVKQILAKYLEAKQRISQLQKKLQKANDKIVELLQQKIILGSPKANNSKKFEFPTDIKQERGKNNIKQLDSFSKNRHQIVSNQSTQKSPSPHHHKFQQTINESIKQKHNNLHNYTNPNFRKDFFSPQQNRLIKIEDEQAQECSYYEKSLKIKNGHKFKELKCTNHEIQ